VRIIDTDLRERQSFATMVWTQSPLYCPNPDSFLRGDQGWRHFVAGASGAIGKPLVRSLVAAGHRVIGMATKAEGKMALHNQGAEGVGVGDALDMVSPWPWRKGPPESGQKISRGSGNGQVSLELVFRK
jgi:hypothetical protein